MNSITKFDRQNLRELRSEIEAALTIIAQKHDISIDVANGSFSDNTYSCRIKCATRAGKQASSVIFGIDEPIVRGVTTFKFNTSVFTVVEINNTKPKYKILAQNQNGTKYWFQTSLVVENRLS
jgi:hypothetical protein